MASSFLEDLLKREIDQSQVNQLVGNLENALGSSRPNEVPTGIVASVTAGKNINSVSQPNTIQATLPSSASALPVSIRTINTNNTVINIGTPKPNGTITSRNPILVNPATSSVSLPGVTLIKTMHSPAITPAGVASTINNVTPRTIKGPIKGAVPIAPRVMITPRQAQLLMAAQPHFNPALLGNNLIRMGPGGIPVMPRIPGHGIAVPPVMNTQIPGIGPIPRGAILNMVKQDPRIIRMPAGAVSTLALSQVKGLTTSIPTQVNYRFRQVNPTTNNTPVNGVTSATNNVTMMRESVKRLKEFFQNLINLACGPNQPPDIGKMVKELVHNLMQGRVSEEEFIEKLQKTLKSDPQPNLVHFLKKTLPHLRETIKKQQMQQVTKGAQLVTQGAVSASKLKPAMNTIRVPAARKNLMIPEQMLQKHMLNSVTATSGQSSAINALIQGAPQRGGFAAGGMKGAGKAANLGQGKEKQKSSTYFSSASGADDDIIDVTCMAGVNLQEESQKILSTGDFMSYQTRSIKDKPILNVDLLKRMTLKKAHLQGVAEITPDALAIISHATEHHMRNILERLTACCMHRNDPHKGEVRYETISDVRNQLRVFEEIDEVERKHRETREREILMRVAKSRSRTEDPEQARLKEKAKQMQLEEEELNRKRAANKTALEAIGGKKKKRKLDEALESLQNATTPGNNTNATSSTPNMHSVSQSLRAKQHRITMKDYHLVLETEKSTTKSMALYRSFLR